MKRRRSYLVLGCVVIAAALPAQVKEARRHLEAVRAAVAAKDPKSLHW